MKLKQNFPTYCELCSDNPIRSFQVHHHVPLDCRYNWNRTKEFFLNYDAGYPSTRQRGEDSEGENISQCGFLTVTRCWNDQRQYRSDSRERERRTDSSPRRSVGRLCRLINYSLVVSFKNDLWIQNRNWDSLGWVLLLFFMRNSKSSIISKPRDWW